MIGFLKGRLHSKQPPLLVLDVQGVGYEVEAPMSTFYALGEVDSEAVLLTHMHVREDAMLLFGFATETERSLFKELIKVNGIGAKMAVGILSAMSANEFVSAVDQADALALTRIPGVGKKTAERLVIEMRDRLKNLTILQNVSQPTTQAGEAVAVPQVSASQIQQSAIDALVALGYKTAQAEKMVKAVQDPEASLEAIIKQALQQVKI